MRRVLAIVGLLLVVLGGSACRVDATVTVDVADDGTGLVEVAIQLDAAAEEFGWELDNGQIALLWRGGCIIRATFLEDIKAAFDRDADLENLLLDDFFRDAIETAQPSWRRVVATAVELGLPVPGFSAALAYFDGYRRGRLPANLLQAQRDYFGAHTYRRLDPEGTFHTDWIRERQLED